MPDKKATILKKQIKNPKLKVYFHFQRINFKRIKYWLTWNVRVHAWTSHILNAFATNFSRVATSQSVISPLVDPTVQHTP